jgi:hypothetical protein
MPPSIAAVGGVAFGRGLTMSRDAPLHRTARNPRA